MRVTHSSLLCAIGLLALSCIPIAAQRKDGPPVDETAEAIVSAKEIEAARQRKREVDDLHALTSAVEAINQRQADEKQAHADNEPKNWGQSFWHALLNPIASNWALAFFAAIAAGIAAKTLGAIKREVGLTNQSLIMVNRPKIIIRDVWVDENSYPGGLITMISHAAFEPFNIPDLAVSYRAMNKGTTNATIQGTDVQLFLGRDLPARNPCMVDESKEKPLTLSPGVSNHYLRTLPFPRHAPLLPYQKRSGREPILYIIGLVHYIDDLGNRRRTGFCRRWNSDDRRFEIVNEEPDYEYVD